MTDLYLRFGSDGHSDLPLAVGVHSLGRSGGGIAPVPPDASWLLQLSNDRRGIWMNLAAGVQGVHVNGRPVRQLALLRAGDCIHVDDRELLLVARTRAATDGATVPPEDPAAGVRRVLRGVGGHHHGRSFALDRPCHIGSAEDAALRLDGEGILPHHALVEAADGRLHLRDVRGRVLVNGEASGETLLHGGDQLTFGVGNRFIVEAPPSQVPPPARKDAADAPPAPPPRGWVRRVPWLLVAALGLAAGLTALLAFGAR